NAYNETAKEIKDIAEWLIVVDTDEYLFPVKEHSLKSALKKYDNYASLSVNWKLFGSSNVERVKDNKLLIETLKLSQKEPDLHVKTIVKPRYVENITHPHFPKLKTGYAQVTENYEYFIGPFSPS